MPDTAPLAAILATAAEHQRLAAISVGLDGGGSPPPWSVAAGGRASDESAVIDQRDRYVASVDIEEDAAVIVHGRVALDVLAAFALAVGPALAEWMAACDAVDAIDWTDDAHGRVVYSRSCRRLTAASKALRAAVGVAVARDRDRLRASSPAALPQGADAFDLDDLRAAIALRHTETVMAAAPAMLAEVEQLRSLVDRAEGVDAEKSARIEALESDLRMSRSYAEALEAAIRTGGGV